MWKVVFILVGLLFASPIFAQVYGSDLTTGLTPTCSSQYSVPEWQCINGNDNNTATAWSSADAALPQYMTFDFTTDKAVAKISLNNTNRVLYLNAWTYYGSANGSTWYALYSDVVPEFAGWYDFEFAASTTEYRYGRLHISSNHTGGNSGGFAEIEIKECESGCGGAEGSSSTLISFNTDQNVLETTVDNLFWGIIIGSLVGAVWLALRGRKTKII